jgi:hypothetical protein
MSRAESGLGWKPSRDPRHAIMQYGRYLKQRSSAREAAEHAPSR